MGKPKVAPPRGGGEGCSACRYSPATRTENRLLNFRVYESHNERAGKKKIEMFNKGELALFRRVGLTPVFFGETVVGSAMPNLTYLLVLIARKGWLRSFIRFLIQFGHGRRHPAGRQNDRRSFLRSLAATGERAETYHQHHARQNRPHQPPDFIAHQ